MEFLEIKSTRKYVSWHYILMSPSAGYGEIMQCLGEIARISYLSSKCSDARSPGKLESTGKSEAILTFIKSQFLVQFLISEKPSISRNQGVSHLMLFVVNCTALMLLIGLNSNAIVTYSYHHIRFRFNS